MPSFLPFAVPDITEEDIAAVTDTLRSGWLTTGPKTAEFERRFALAVGAPHAVMVNSGTAALHLALEALGVRRGDEVILPTMTFASTAEVVVHLGATPVLVDVKASDHNLDPACFERAITSRTRAVMPVHFAGQPCDMAEIVSIARGRGLGIVDDAAHAFPATYRGEPVGRLADITCFSFYATKTLTTGEGGAAVTGSKAWADRMRSMALHGLSVDAWKRYSSEGSWKYEIMAPGYKYNLTDMASALGLGQLARAAAALDRRSAIAARYDAAFSGSGALELLTRAPDRVHAHHIHVLKLASGATEEDRSWFIQRLREAGIGTSVHFIPLHAHPYYRQAFGYEPLQLPVAYDVYQRSLSLPIHARMTDADVGRVIDAVLEAARELSGGRRAASDRPGALPAELRR